MSFIIKFLTIVGFLFFTSCEDEDGTAAEDSLLGTWNFVATEYDTTCAGNGEVFLEGTMLFDDENVTVTSELRFDSFSLLSKCKTVSRLPFLYLLPPIINGLLIGFLSSRFPQF